jgi:flotillin
MLPEIVRAAAEPLGNIDTLTVLSNDGASDVVKSVTRTVAEANATVTGLTGIDIPALISNAVGGTPPSESGGGGGPQRRTGGGGSGGPGGGGGGGRGGGAASGRSGPEGPAPGTDRPPTTDASGSAGPTGPAWGARPPTGPTPIETAAAADAAMAAADKAIKAAAATPAAAAPEPAKSSPKTDTAAGPARPATRPASAEITTETTVEDAATRLASDLRAVPGIERFATVRLGDLDEAGPRPLRTMWRISRDQLDQRYSQMTIGELIDRYGGGPTPPA